MKWPAAAQPDDVGLRAHEWSLYWNVNFRRCFGSNWCLFVSLSCRRLCRNEEDDIAEIICTIKEKEGRPKRVAFLYKRLRQIFHHPVDEFVLLLPPDDINFDWRFELSGSFQIFNQSLKSSKIVLPGELCITTCYVSSCEHYTYSLSLMSQHFSHINHYVPPLIEFAFLVWIFYFVVSLWIIGTVIIKMW